MSVDRYMDHEFTEPSPEHDPELIAKDFGYVSTIAMAQTIPYQASVLGIGAKTASLGDQISAYRYDIAWTTVDEQPTETESLFTQVYCHDETVNPETLIELLTTNGKLYMGGRNLSNGPRAITSATLAHQSAELPYNQQSFTAENMRDRAILVGCIAALTTISGGFAVRLLKQRR